MKNFLRSKVTRILFTVILLASCQKNAQELTPKFSHPYKPKEMHFNRNVKRIVIASTNNFKSSLRGTIDNTVKQKSISVGGIDLLSEYIDILRRTYKNNVLLVDSGYFIGNDTKKLLSTFKYYEDTKYDAVLFTENEILKTTNNNETTIPFVNSNIIDLKRSDTLRSYGSRPYLVKEINGVRVAILGVTDYKSHLENNKKIDGLLFDDPIARIISLKREVSKKADVVILLAHLVKAQKKEMENLIHRLPPNFIDVIVGGGQQHIHEVINGIPVIQNTGEGLFINRVELFYNPRSKMLENDKTILHSPTKICSRFFSATNDCHVSKGSIQKFDLIKKSQYKLKSAKFLGLTVSPRSQIFQTLNAN